MSTYSCEFRRTAILLMTVIALALFASRAEATTQSLCANPAAPNGLGNHCAPRDQIGTPWAEGQVRHRGLPASLTV